MFNFEQTGVRGLLKVLIIAAVGVEQKADSYMQRY
jgi:hypothetical protein